jgi:hypothetical protein
VYRARLGSPIASSCSGGAPDPACRVKSSPLRFRGRWRFRMAGLDTARVARPLRFRRRDSQSCWVSVPCVRVWLATRSTPWCVCGVVRPSIRRPGRMVPLACAAGRHRQLTGEIRDLDRRITALIRHTAPQLLDLYGVGPDTAAQLLVTAGDNPERLRTPAAFAALTGTAPVQASSGNTRRHRLSRGGDRQANRALHMIAVTRLSHDPRTRVYLERRTGEGLSRKEIIRCQKRYIANEVYKALTTLPPPPTPATNSTPRLDIGASGEPSRARHPTAASLRNPGAPGAEAHAGSAAGGTTHPTATPPQHARDRDRGNGSDTDTDTDYGDDANIDYDGGDKVARHPTRTTPIGNKPLEHFDISESEVNHRPTVARSSLDCRSAYSPAIIRRRAVPPRTPTRSICWTRWPPPAPARRSRSAAAAAPVGGMAGRCRCSRSPARS